MLRPEWFEPELLRRERERDDEAGRDKRPLHAHIFLDAAAGGSEEGEQADRLEALVRSALNEKLQESGEAEPEGLNQADSEDGRYWARTSDPQLVELVLSQLS